MEPLLHLRLSAVKLRDLGLNGLKLRPVPLALLGHPPESRRHTQNLSPHSPDFLPRFNAAARQLFNDLENFPVTFWPVMWDIGKAPYARTAANA